MISKGSMNSRGDRFGREFLKLVVDERREI